MVSAKGALCPRHTIGTRSAARYAALTRISRQLAEVFYFVWIGVCLWAVRCLRVGLLLCLCTGLRIYERRMKIFAGPIFCSSLVGFDQLISWRWFKRREQITLDAVGGSSRTSIELFAHGAAVWAEENVWSATTAVEELSIEVMDEN